MTFRGVYRDGVVILDDHEGLRNGAVVKVTRSTRGRKATGKAKTTTPKRGAKKAKDPLLALAGIWKNRAEWKGKTTLQIVQELRRKALGGRTRG
jgi:hypothetical protein